MRNCLILGSGRSGTSMIAGLLRDVGYFMGNNLIGPKPENPKGMFEDREINRINEDILASIENPLLRLLPANIFRSKLRYGQRWLARIPAGTPMAGSASIERRIRSQLKQEPYCIKDPRLSYTLPVWRPFLSDPLLICVFREPARTANSVVRTC